MMDKVNIIENLEELEWFLLNEYEKAKDDIDTWYFRYHAVSDARELLKKAVEPKLGTDEASHWICGACHVAIFPYGVNYCHYCGRAVKWDGRQGEDG